MTDVRIPRPLWIDDIADGLLFAAEAMPAKKRAEFARFIRRQRRPRQGRLRLS